MRYLSSISLALVVLMALACTATPAATPTPPGPMLSEAEAIAVVKNHLGLKNVGELNCGAAYNAHDAKWTANYAGDGVWKIEGLYTKGYRAYEDPGTWDMYEKTESVVVTSTHNC